MMKKIKYTYLTTTALFIILFNLSAICQDSYQSSTFNGFGIRISALGDFWKGEIITDKSTFGGGIDVTAMYGIGEVIGIYAGYQNIFPASLEPSEIGYLIYTDKVKHQNFTAGLMAHLGSTSSKLRYTVLAGIMAAQSTTEILQDQFDILLDIKLKGVGLNAGVGLDYFISPFLSTSLYFNYNSGNYKNSEYLGITYKESLKWSRPQVALGISYHFAGR
nr:outer membrane beta-barrel protein [Candidatus Brachybacter algidus]